MEPPRAPPELIEDATVEILVRLPPDDPASLVRASLVCKPWRRILSDPAFSRRYREFHPTPPLLGYLRCHHPCRDELVAATAFPFSCPKFKYRRWWSLDCRHGRVLLHHLDPTSGLIVWDPITDDQQYLPVPAYSHKDYAGAVLCTAHGCNHLNCHGGPFVVVFVLNGNDSVTRVCAYSSETGEWSPPASIPKVASYVEGRDSLFTGGALYFTLKHGISFLKYYMAGQGLSVIPAPHRYEDDMLPTIGIVDEEGRLGFVAIEDDANL